MGKKGYRKFKGCDEVCENCPYPDCYKPARLMRPTRELGIEEVQNRGKDQQKMYTLALGGYGGATPNTKRKFYL